MRTWPSTLLVFLLVLLAASPAAWARKAFPTAEGYGADTITGGAGGVVMFVTNINDSGPGSLRACMEGTGARTCIFRVAGMINLSRSIDVNEPNSNLTVAGQTAPSPGITVGPWSINIQYGAHNVIIRHLRHRQAFEDWGQAVPYNTLNNDCGGFTLYGPDDYHTHHIILDHVSTGYTCDDSMQMSGWVTDSTIQWALVADPYECKRQPDNSCALDPYGASKGFIFGGNNPATAPLSTGTVHHSLFANTGTRNPGGGPQHVMDWRYNLIYHWFACTGGLRVGGTDENVPGSLQSNHNFVGNRYIAGPETNTSGCWLGELRTEGNAHVYVQDNVTPFCGMDTCASTEWFLGWGNGTTQGFPADPALFRVFSPFSAPAVTATPRTSMESILAANAGATVPLRDALDTRVIQEMQQRSGTIGRLGAPFPSLPTVLASPVDSDNDGMPDAWELSHGLNPNSPGDRNLIATNGYTNLENYLNELAGDTIGGLPAPPPDATLLACSAPRGLGMSGTGWALRPFKVYVTDSSQNLVGGATDFVTASLASGPSGAQLSGTLTAQAVSEQVPGIGLRSVATFTNLVLTGAGTSTLTFTAPGLTACTTASFRVGPSFHLGTTSPARGAGQALPGVILTDFDGFAVVQSGVIDAGALQYRTPGSVPPPPTCPGGEPPPCITPPPPSTGALPPPQNFRLGT